MRYGVKAALNDAEEMAALDVELLEVHLLVEDLARRRSALVEAFQSVRSDWGHDIVVHAPEFMPSPGEPILVDLSAEDDTMRQMSLANLEASIEFAQEVEATLIVTHPGGIYPASEDPKAEGGMERLAVSLDRLSDMAHEADLLMTLENMPWYYHRKPVAGGEGERWESTLLVVPDGIEVLGQSFDGFTLDVSHGYLYRPTGGMETIRMFVERYGDRILHMHLSDALPPDHEGLQVGEGSVDFKYVLGAMRDRDVSAVPEIIGGHRGGGIGFRRALEELRSIEKTL
jgi:N-acetylneuraminate synthase